MALAETFQVRTGRVLKSDACVPEAIASAWPTPSQAGGQSASIKAASASLPPLSPALLLGLARASWPGRAHSLPVELVSTEDHGGAAGASERWRIAREACPSMTKLQILLDGAHTSASMQQAVSWFADATAPHPVSPSSPSSAEASAPALATTPTGPRRVLVFGCSHGKDVVQLLLPLLGVPWSRVVFCPLLATRPSRHGPPGVDGLIEAFWQRKAEAASDGDKAGARADAAAAGAHSAAPVESSAAVSRSWCDTLCALWARIASDATLAAEREDVSRPGSALGREVPEAAAASSIGEALRMALPTEAIATSVFVTGSLYLVGDCLTAIGWDPDSDVSATIRAKGIE